MRIQDEMPSAAARPPVRFRASALRGYPAIIGSTTSRMAMTRWLIDAAAHELDLARPRSTPHLDPRTARLPAFDDPCWLDLPRLSEGHGLSALIGAARRQQLPSDVRLALEDTARRTRERDDRLRRDTARIEAAFVAQGIPSALLKGSALLETRWDTEARRPRADIDLYVPRTAMKRAEAALMQLGYAWVDENWKHRRFLLPDNQQVIDRRGEHPANPRPVELHPRIVESFRGIECDLGPLVSAERPFDAMPPTLLLCHLLVHASVDALQRKLRALQLVELARLIDESTEAELKGLMDIGREPAVARFIWPALHCVERFVMPLPEDLARSLSTACPTALLRWLDGVDPDALSYFGRKDRSRVLMEVPRIWPQTRAETLTVWRFILVPGRKALADRYPGLAGSWTWPLMYARHAMFTVVQAARRIRLSGLEAGRREG